MDLIIIDVTYWEQDQDNRKIVLNINGGLHGKITANNIHDACMKLMQSNVLSDFHGNIYVNLCGYGIAVVDELKHSFGSTVNSFIPRAIRIWQ